MLFVTNRENTTTRIRPMLQTSKKMTIKKEPVTALHIIDYCHPVIRSYSFRIILDIAELMDSSRTAAIYSSIFFVSESHFAMIVSVFFFVPLFLFLPFFRSLLFFYFSICCSLYNYYILILYFCQY